MSVGDHLITGSSNSLPLVSENQRREHDQDRISQLPDPIIHLIFSFLSIRDAVWSSVLAKRWIRIWASIQFLAFDRLDFHSDEHFVNFVNGVLLFRNPLNVDAFSLTWLTSFDEDHAKLWIIYAIYHNVQALDLNVSRPGNEVALPHFLFTCRSLEALRLSVGDGIISCPAFASFTRLRKLYIYSASIPLDDLKRLISRCPVVEDVYLLVQFCIPSLKSLHYETSNITGTSFADLSSLVCAFVSADVGLFGGVPQSNVVNKLIGAFSKSKLLKLFGQWIELVTEEELSEFPTFRNLETLMVDRCCMSNFQAVANFLRHSPNLEFLILTEPIERRSCACGSGTVRKQVDLSFDCPHLELIEIQCSKTNEGVSDLVKILLENSKTLPRIQIITE